SCTVPAKGTPTFSLCEDEMEYGVGIHGEPGVAREKLISADELANKMLDKIIADLPFSKGDEVALMVNGMGATPLQELYILNNSVGKVLNSKKINVYKTFVGNYMTSIDMSGASLTLMKLDNILKELLDAPTDTPAFKIQ
ncbi:MAG TPA: dihydroxyacetone kinase subunit DhaK, partial [Anaerovoracaceae bacterium]|nr:dihydroxyacetone kinase subunit DhaK [Anaerovoracaceae bacterium]